ncbi:transcription elongation factor S-II family protein [Myriangium duriaei CBS 260.36]|uniref:Transcription elongation factor n=1 Tax=Myriangium duriaei CBS 260.36 TaxID=1168546 RepID=A0A9P4J9B6_9PEZI|nr:transcription elongation factor S-II family protein [Myriangium duriaei CBS 260.36]
MEAKDIEDRAKQITKAFTEGDPPATLVSLLEPLKGWTATEKLLRQTNIGRTMSKLRQHKDQNVARVATSLVTKWKSDVKKPGSPAPGAKTAPAGTNGTSSPAAASTPRGDAQKSKYKGNPEKRNVTTDGVKYEVTGNATRDACVKLMYDGLAFMSEEASEDIFKVARNVELAAYDKYQPETSSEYKTRLRSLFQNLKNKSNPGLRADVFSGAIEPARFVVMTHEELKSDKMKAVDQKLEKENLHKAMVAQEEKSISTSLTCGKCGQKKVSYSQAQTRSADEPMTTFCECTVCGNRWKFS